MKWQKLPLKKSASHRFESFFLMVVLLLFLVVITESSIFISGSFILNRKYSPVTMEPAGCSLNSPLEICIFEMKSSAFVLLLSDKSASHRKWSNITLGSVLLQGRVEFKA